MAGASPTAVRPRTFRYQDAELRCAVRRTFGYEAYCACGWVGKVRRTVAEARAENRQHRCEDVSATRGAEASVA